MPDGKQPYFISAADGGVLSIAGLWDRCHSTDTGETVLSCTLIVTDADAFSIPRGSCTSTSKKHRRRRSSAIGVARLSAVIWTANP